MLAKLKLAVYVGLAAMALWCGIGFYVDFTAVSISGANLDLDARAAIAMGDAAPTNPAVPPAGTNAAAGSDTQPAASPAAPPAPATNEAAPVLGSADTTNPPAVPPKSVKARKKTHVDIREAVTIATAETRRHMITCLAGLVLALAGLGVLGAYDFSRLFAHRAVDALFDDDGPTEKAPEYENAEQVWAEGRQLEAIEMMRVYLQKNPREQYVALRIAEIYEKDFNNFLAAAMEYEEVLKHKLNPDRWGWTAIHLCNLYSKLDRPDDRQALLQRIVDEHPKTSAAKKARKHLGLPEDEPDLETSEPAPNRILNAPAPIALPPQDPNMPKGFRRKK